MAVLFNVIADAKSANEADILGLCGFLICMAERSALARTHVNVNQADADAAGAEFKCKCEWFNTMKTAEGHYMSGILFDDVFTDMAFYRPIQESAAGCPE